ncbi:MAG: serine/threonine-protein kinase [Planctomycetota bacterium]
MVVDSAASLSFDLAPSPGDTAPPLLASGARIAHYDIGHRIARGAMGEVYAAHQQTLDRPVAVKILLPELAEQVPELAAQFLHEACAAARLDHPNVIMVHDSGTAAYGGTTLHWFAMELVEGYNLKRLLEDEGPLPADRVRGIMHAIAGALSHAAARGMVHRDIKPDNIMLTAGGTVKLTDFGLVLWEALDGETPLADRWVGTPRYISPEQILRRPTDVRSDLYSLGATAYHLLLGRPPFVADDRKSILQAHLEAEPEDPRHELDPAGQALAAVILRLLRKQPAKRYPDAESLLTELDRLDALTAHDGTGTTRTSARHRVRRRGRRRR